MIPDILTSTAELSRIEKGVRQVLRILLSSDLQHQLWPLQIIFVIIGIFFAWMVVYYSIKTSYWENKWISDIKNFLFPKIFEHKAQVRRWQKIRNGLDKNYEDQWKLSLIEAADFLNDILKSAGFGGVNLEERLQKATTEDIPNIKELLNVPKVYSDIVRDPNYRLAKPLAKEIVGQIEHTLKELDIL